MKLWLRIKKWFKKWLHPGISAASPLNHPEVLELQEKKKQLELEIALEREKWDLFKANLTEEKENFNNYQTQKLKDFAASQEELLIKLSVIEQEIIKKSKNLEELVKRHNETALNYQTMNNRLKDINSEISSAVETRDELLKEIESKHVEKEKIAVELAGVSKTFSEMIKKKLVKEGGHKLDLNENEIHDIEALLGLIDRFKNPKPLYKALWEAFYRDKMKAMRQKIGVDVRKSGIYRLWTVEEDETTGEKFDRIYVGQAVDIGDRWVTHLKRLCKADDVGCNVKLYNSGIKPYELYWEVLEYCDSSKLGELEKKWIEFYSANNGYNSK